MNKNYDFALKEIPFFNIHEEYLPFIGDKYGEKRFLIVGESHYIGQNQSSDKFLLSYFAKHWWNENCSELNQEYSGYFNTREVVENYLNGYRRKGHLIFTNLAKTFSEIVLDQKIDRINTSNSQVFQNFAFMNFFQMPSLFHGVKYWDSLKIAEKSSNEKEFTASETWEKCTEISSDVLNTVIDILKPRIIVFSSESAYFAFLSSNTPHSKDDYIKCIPHAGCAWWNRISRRYGNRTGRELFCEVLNEYLNSTNSD